MLSKDWVASHSGLDLHVRTVLILSHSHEHSLLWIMIGQVVDRWEREYIITMAGWSALEPETSILHGYPTIPHLFISFAVAFSPIGHVCECIRARVV